MTLVTDNGGPFLTFRFEAFIMSQPELRHVRTRFTFPGQKGSRERGFESLKCERLCLHEITDGLDLVEHAEDYRIDYNTIKPREALALNSPLDVHLSRHDPSTPNFPEAKILPTSRHGLLIAPKYVIHASSHSRIKLTVADTQGALDCRPTVQLFGGVVHLRRTAKIPKV